MSSTGVSATKTIIAGVSSALVAGLIVSIGVAHAAPAGTTGSVVAASVAPAPIRIEPTAASRVGAATAAASTSAGNRAVGARTPQPSTSVPPAPAASSVERDLLGPLGSPDVGEHCAEGLDAQQLSDFFSQPIGAFQGADYQRAIRLSDDRVLWTFQDAFVSGTLVHNVAMVQSGRCFTLLNDGAVSWLFADDTSHMRQWHWILGGGVDPVAGRIHLFVVQMNETGGTYLSRTRPTALRRVVLDEDTLDVVEVVDESMSGGDLYGWSVTNDDTYTYLYAHCYQQFGYDTMLGIGECAVDVELARVPLGQFGAAREYWDGTAWSSDITAAAPVVDGTFAGSGNNPAQIGYDGTRFVLVQKRDDWWGTVIDFGVADDPQGPFLHVGSAEEQLTCGDPLVCNTYFAAWIPWSDSNGGRIWSIGHNRWNGAETAGHLVDYRPTFHTVDL